MKTLDNDVTTDEEQVSSAIENLKNSVIESIKKRKSLNNSNNLNNIPAKNDKEKQKKVILIR